MNTPIPTNDYMLLFRGTDWDCGLSPEQLQQVVADWAAWFERLTQQGKAVSGHPLTNDGRIVSGKQGRTVADGPFAESKEAVGGYFYLKVADMEEAVEVARQCPGLEHGAIVEVRQVADLCMTRQHAMGASPLTGELAATTA